MVVTAPQLTSLAIERLAGSIGVTTDWREPVKASTIERDPGHHRHPLGAPERRVGSGDLVIVSLKVRFGTAGTARLPPRHRARAVGPGRGRRASRASRTDDSEEPPAGFTFPFDQTAQRVSFCADNETKDHVADLRYVARVVTPGTYTWEPAVVESRTSTNHAALTGSDTVTIR